jgi:hypothetical protein
MSHDEAVSLARSFLAGGDSEPYHPTTTHKIAAALLALHAENERLRAGCTACRLEHEADVEIEADRDRLRAGLKEALEEQGMQLAALEGYQCWNPDALQRRRDRIAELRKEHGL